ncbi:MAG: CehA/McbA family metallohydrolase [Chitinispirillales bacterium]|jgi:hypothetical protein|nr:CehA/McbA family metallohydrolase [Chitinispirillales bacterium]
MTELLLPAALYAETHFRFFGWSPSALFRREPEIVFDLPRRITREADLPIVLMVNDAHLYPICIESVQVTISLGPLLFEFDQSAIQKSEIDHLQRKQLQAYILTVPRSELPPSGGEVFVNACLRYRRIKNGTPQNKIYTVLNDNLITSTKFAFRCFIANDDYPGSDFCTFGDVHCHSIFSRSHVEWGPPLEVIDRMAAASGLSFVAVTDHSYDLACDPDNYLRQDKNLRLWKLYKSCIDNYKGTTVLMPGEEISVLNSRKKAVHLCGLGLSEYIPGTLDGARRNIRGDRQLTIDEAIDEIERQGGVSFAAHPGVKAGFMQRIFLRRGMWGADDLCGKLGGIQAANGDFYESWKRGKNLWISMIQKGRRIPILGGSDAHGDFNRYRAIGIPFLQIHEAADRYMGFARTGIYGEKMSDAAGIISKIRDAATFVTNGPFVSICDSRRPEISLIGSKTIADKTNLCARAISTKEFGALGAIGVFMMTGTAGEKLIINEKLPPDTYDATIPIPTDALSEGNSYLRVEAYGRTPRDLVTTAATSACFVE